MRISLRISLALLNLLPIIAAIPSPIVFTRSDNLTRLPPSISTIQQELGRRLSKHASLYFPGSPGCTNDTESWAANTESNLSVIVVPAIGQDVAATVRFADIYNIPFLAINKAHGTAAALSMVYNSTGIYVRALDSMEISEDGNSALMGSGVYQNQFVNFLWDHGKVSPSGACVCTGIMGPGLGGGFGRYEGYFGLVLDNITDMDAVLADGSTITVSQSSHSDLYWGMRGAEHNVGIVTRFTQKIFNIPYPECIFRTIEHFGANGTQPKEAVTYSFYTLNPEISATEPVIAFSFVFSGPAANAAPMLAPFYALQPVVATNETVPYPGVADAAGTGSTDEMVNEYPAFWASIVQFEGYPQEAVQAVESDSTTYAHREEYVLVSYTSAWSPNDTALAAVAYDYSHQARALLHAGDTPGHLLNAYVNYASIDETPEMLYGYEPWRLERLRSLKSKYDPRGRFNFYNPAR